MVESYSQDRNNRERYVSADLFEAKKDWDWIKAQDTLFLHNSEISRLLEKHDVDYVNITEEFWSGRMVNKELIKRLVEDKYSPVMNESLYSYVPTKLYNLKGSILISFARIKELSSYFKRLGVSLSTKNLFGLIPDPNRLKRWHGVDNVSLSQSIIDINKIYRCLFDVVGINEGIFHLLVFDPKGIYGYSTVEYSRTFEEYKLGIPVHMTYNVLENLGLAIFGDETINLDAFTSQLLGVDPNSVGYLKLGVEVFGEWNKNLVEKAKRMVGKEHFFTQSYWKLARRKKARN